MNDTISCSVQLPDGTAKGGLPMDGRSICLIAAGTSLIVGAAIVVSLQLSLPFLMPNQPDKAFSYHFAGTIGTGRALAAIFLAGIGAMAITMAGVARKKEALLQANEEREKSLQKTITGLQLQLSESQMVEAQIRDLKMAAETRVIELEAAHTSLADELNKLKRNEKALAQQRQALESSKNVLEIHVQARTRELQKLQRRYEQILNSAGEGICGLDAEGRTTFANPAVAKITGWAIDELLGKSEKEVFSFDPATGQALPDGQCQIEQVFSRKDGQKVLVEFIRTPIKENDAVTGAVLVFKDITKRKQVEESLARKAAELQRSNAELEQFAFVASHDLQEPLRKIQAFGDRLKVKCEGITSEARDYLDRMQSASARMRNLIDDLLAFSRAIRSAEPFVPVDLSQLTREVLGDVEVRIEKTGAVVHVGDMPQIEADPMQMRQMMLNLISNALKFQAPGAKPYVKIEGRLIQTPGSEVYCEITVADNGIGFDEKYMDKVFAVFQRLHGRTEYEGTGVGLAVCRRITDRHRGTITARSQPGKGTTFVITVPVRQPKPNAPA